MAVATVDGTSRRPAAPAEIYISLVDALQGGALAAAISALITAWKIAEQALYMIGISA